MTEYKKDGATKFAHTPEQEEIFVAAGWVLVEEAPVVEVKAEKVSKKAGK